MEGTLHEVSIAKSTSCSYSPRKQIEIKFLLNKCFQQSFKNVDYLCQFFQTHIDEDGKMIGSIIYEAFGTEGYQINLY